MGWSVNHLFMWPQCRVFKKLPGIVMCEVVRILFFSFGPFAWSSNRSGIAVHFGIEVDGRAQFLKFPFSEAAELFLPDHSHLDTS